MPFVRAGFRKVLCAVIIMCIVLFYRKGIMGDKEFSIEGIANFFRNRFKKKKVTEGGASK